MVLAGRDRGHGARVLAPVGRGLDLSRGPEWATWFVGGRVSIARNCVHRWAESRPDAIAAVFAGEDGERREVTFAEMSRDVTRLAEGLASLGVREATRSRSTCRCRPRSRSPRTRAPTSERSRCRSSPASPRPPSPPASRTPRRRWSSPRTARSAAAATIPMKEVVDEAAASRRRSSTWSSGRGSAARCRCTGDATSAGTSSSRRSPASSRPLEVDSETPYLLTYTSGTTGRRRESSTSRAASSSRSRARSPTRPTPARTTSILFSTDMGWIMGPWTVVGGGAVGATLVFMEGAPDQAARPPLEPDRAGARDRSSAARRP